MIGRRISIFNNTGSCAVRALAKASAEFRTLVE
jgi:hypothetical protein